MSISHTYATITILIRDGSAYDRISIYSFSSGSVTSSGYQFNSNLIVDAGIKGSSPGLTAVASGAGEMLIWGDSLFYSPNAGINVFSISLLSRDPARPATGLSSSEYITSVVSSTTGRFAVLTSTNRYSLYAILFDSLGRLVVLTPSSTSYYIATRIIPADNNVISPSGRLEIQVRPNNDSLVCTSKPKVAVVRVGCPPTRRLVLRRQSIATPIASPEPRYFWGTRYTATTTTTSTTAAAATPTIPVTDCSTAPSQITVPGGFWISDWSSLSRGSSDKTVAYNCTKYGAPVTVYYGDYYMPVFDVFDGTKYVATVNADIGLWEYNGRTSFTFNTTAVAAGCRIKAQTWTQMASLLPSDPSNALTSTNYVACYSSSLAYTLSGNDQYAAYTFINQTNYNALLWTDGLGGYYMFKARVLDANYSYCDLTADFAINVVGTPLNWGIQVGIVMGLVTLGIGLLSISYLDYAKKQKAEREREALMARGSQASISVDKLGRTKEKIE
eukprot:jgi/Hompol1/1041/HPOL_004442-RA